MLTSPDDCKLHPLKSCAHVTPAAERDRLCQKPSHSPETARVPGAVTAPRWKHRGGLVCSGGGVQPDAALASPASPLRPARSCRRPAPWSCTACIALAGTRGPGSVPGRGRGRAHCTCTTSEPTHQPRRHTAPLTGLALSPQHPRKGWFPGTWACILKAFQVPSPLPGEALSPKAPTCRAPTPCALGPAELSMAFCADPSEEEGRSPWSRAPGHEGDPMVSMRPWL